MTEPTPPPTSADLIRAATQLAAAAPTVDDFAAGAEQIRAATPTGEELAAALKTLASAGISFDTAASTYTDHGRAALAAALGTPPPGETDDVTTCGHPDGCTNPATHQTSRPTTDDEAAAHWDALEENIRSKGNPDYVQNRDDTVTIAEHRCDDPGHADPAYLEAQAATATFATAMAELTTAAARFSTEQIQQLTDAIKQITGEIGGSTSA